MDAVREFGRSARRSEVEDARVEVLIEAVRVLGGSPAIAEVMPLLFPELMPDLSALRRPSAAPSLFGDRDLCEN